jgi:hypothetical protein
MKSFEHYFMNKQYARVQELGDKLAEIDPLIDWEFFRPIVREMYDNHTEKGGRPNNDEIVMVKMLVLQAWYGGSVKFLGVRYFLCVFLSSFPFFFVDGCLFRLLF